MTIRKKLVLSAAAMIVIGSSFGAYAGYLQIVGNFHTVIEGQLYRSAQPSASELSAYIRDHGIKTVINLRGASPQSNWYQAEVKTAQALGVNHVDFTMSATKILSSDKADKLMEIMADAPKPILVHCQSGADRTGLVSAMYSFWIAGRNERVSEGQLSFFYGHIGIPYLSATWAMDESWEHLEENLPFRSQDLGDQRWAVTSLDTRHWKSASENGLTR